MTRQNGLVSSIAIGILLVTSALAGCLGDIDTQESPRNPKQTSESLPGDESIPTEEPIPNNIEANQGPIGSGLNFWQYDILPPVALLRDSGINVYHEEFRIPVDFDSAQPGYYPPEATLVNITLDADSYPEAFESDRHIWENIEADRVYAFNGTRIVAAKQSGFMDECSPGDPPMCDWPILDRHGDGGGHGSLVTGSIAGTTTGSCPECRIAMTARAGSTSSIAWGIEHDWIDATSVSSVSGTNLGSSFPGAAERWTNSGRTWINGAGNGGNQGGTVSMFQDHAANGIFLVGWWDGEIHESTTRIYDALGQGVKQLPRPDHLTDLRRVSGTSISAPDLSGHYLMVLWELRQHFNDTQGYRDGLLMQIENPEQIPDHGPLSDGVLTAKELEDALRQSAIRVPPKPGVPVIEETSYPMIGYGLVNNESRAQAVKLLLGEEDVPERQWDDWWHHFFQYSQDGYYAYWTCNDHLFPLYLDPENVADYLECMQDARWDPTHNPPALPPV